MKIFIVQGEHFHVGGRHLIAHSTAEGARVEAVKLMNIILKDAGKKALPEDATIEAIDKAVERVNKSRDGDGSCDVWVTEVELKEPPKPTYLHSPDACPSNHWNDGTDTCSDCGLDLNA